MERVGKCPSKHTFIDKLESENRSLPVGRMCHGRLAGPRPEKKGGHRQRTAGGSVATEQPVFQPVHFQFTVALDTTGQN